MPPLQGHSSKMFDMILHGSYIWTSSFDKNISVWDTESYQLIQELKAHTDGVRSLLSIPKWNSVWSGSLEGDGSIIAWGCQDEATLLIRRAQGSSENSHSFYFELESSSNNVDNNSG